MIERLPLVGREVELRTALSALKSAEHRGALLIGPPGVGKTRLATELLDRLRRAGRAVIRCYATDATAKIPFGALASHIPADLETTNPLRHAAGHLIGSQSDRLVLAVDDAHLLDDASVALLQYVMRHDLAKVLCTARPEGSGELLREEGVVLLPVHQLRPHDADDLLSAALGGPVDASTRHLVWSSSQGNPLYLRELVAAGLHSGALARREGGWGWQGPLDVSGRLAELVDLNLGRLTTPQRRAMESLAYGEPLELDLLAALASEEVVDELEALGLLRIEKDDRRVQVRLGHPLYGNRLRETCPTLRARAHRRALADQLEATGARRRGDLMRVATWRLDSNSPASPDLLARAAHQAWAAQDWDLAERLCQEAVALGETRRVGMILSLVLMYRRASEQAEAVLAEVMAATGDDPLTRVQLGCTRAFNLFFGLGRIDEAIAVLDGVTELGLPAELEDTLLYMGLGFALEYAPLSLARAGAEIMVTGEGWGAVAGHQVLGFTQLLDGSYADAHATVERHHGAFTAWRDRYPGLGNGATGILCTSLLRGGELAQAEELAARMLGDVLEESRWAVTQTVPRLLLSHCARLRGHAGHAMRIVAECIADEPYEHPLMWDVMILTELALSAALYGQHARAAAVLDRAEDACRPAWRMAVFGIEIARSWVLAGAGRVADAAAAALATAEMTRAHGAHAYEIDALHDAARFGADTSVRLAELAETRRDPMTTAFARHAQARARRDPRGLEAVATAFTRCGAPLYAAEALAEASRLYRQEGRTREAGQMAQQHAVLVEGFDHATTPGLHVGDALTGLTPRQLEVAQLAAAGLTNQQIADRLAVSKRTVDNHLHAAYSVLGIAGRAELLALFAPGR